MKLSNNQSGNVALIAVALIAGLVIGFAGGHVSKKDSNDKMTKSSDSSTSAPAASAQVDGTTVGGAVMVKDKDIVDNAVNAKNVTTVVAAVKAAGLVDTLKSPGPFTVFAPNNDAFAALPAGTVDTLLKPENKSKLVDILTYHVVPGTHTTAELKTLATSGGTLKTVQGETLSFANENGAVEVVDSKGNKVAIETGDVISSNGVTHVIKSVLMPAN